MAKRELLELLQDIHHRMGLGLLTDEEWELVDRLCLWFDGFMKGRASVLRKTG